METIVKSEMRMDEYEEEYNGKISQKDIEYTDFLCFLLENSNEELAINKAENYLKEEHEDDIIFCEGETFYEKIGIDMQEFEKSRFVSSKYINEMGNSILLIYEIDNVSHRFIVDIV